MAFAVPPGWGSQYARHAKDVPQCDGYRDVPSALGLMSRFLDPVLSGALLTGAWDPNRLAWAE